MGTALKSAGVQNTNPFLFLSVIGSLFDMELTIKLLVNVNWRKADFGVTMATLAEPMTASGCVLPVGLVWLRRILGRECCRLKLPRWPSCLPASLLACLPSSLHMNERKREREGKELLPLSQRRKGKEKERFSLTVLLRPLFLSNSVLCVGPISDAHETPRHSGLVSNYSKHEYVFISRHRGARRIIPINCINSSFLSVLKC